MKIRIKDDSIRLRLTQGEVKTLCSEGLIESRCQINQNINFKYSIKADNTWMITTQGLSMTIHIEKDLIDNWDINSIVGFDQIIKNDKEGLKILIEKDFKCLTPRDENEEDNYENPLKSHNC